MSLFEYAKIVGVVVAALAVALLFDAGIKYRAQLNYAVGADHGNEPSLKIKPSPRHLLLAIIVLIGVYLGYHRGGEVGFPLISFIALALVYALWASVDAIREMRRSRP